ncbi:MAG TPA: DUF4404 family protein [Cellvibrionaceae bacterium]
MPQKKIDHLISHMNELFGDDRPSAAQQRLMQQLQMHAHPKDSEEMLEPGPMETLELMLEEFEEDHPQVASVIRETIDALKNMGV